MDKTASHPQQTRLYTFEVYLISGPISEEFLAHHPVVSRTIEIRGDQTFKDLHHVLFEAFDREDEHMYEFQIGGRGPQDPNATRYVSDPNDPEGASYAGKTPIETVGLQEEQAFGYWFDYGDDWWHQINVLAIRDESPKGRYPKITERTGASPPQYEE